MTGQPFDATEYELIAEALDALLGTADTVAKVGGHQVDMLTRSVLRDIVCRARRHAAELAAANDNMAPELRLALRDVCDDLADRHGRCAVSRIAPQAFVVVGLLGDDIEREWMTVRCIGLLVTTERSTADEVRQSREQAA